MLKGSCTGDRIHGILNCFWVGWPLLSKSTKLLLTCSSLKGTVDLLKGTEWNFNEETRGAILGFVTKSQRCQHLRFNRVLFCMKRRRARRVVTSRMLYSESRRTKPTSAAGLRLSLGCRSEHECGLQLAAKLFFSEQEMIPKHQNLLRRFNDRMTTFPSGSLAFAGR